MNKKVFLTGGTGFLGSNVAYRLLGAGYDVIFLIRQLAGITPEERLEEVFKVIDPNFNLSKYPYQIMTGDICLPNLGLNADNFNYLEKHKPKSIFHCAGATSFSQKQYDKTWKTNVEGTRNVIAIAQKLEVYLNHISTAYQVGNSEGTAQSKIKKASSQHFNNVYEMTKYISEILVSESGLHYSIYRPGIVIGAKNGRTLNFSGYYMYQNTFWRLKKFILSHLNQDKKFYNGTGIKLEKGKLNLPINIKSSFDANLNLVPVDWVANMIVALSEKNLSDNRVFHLTHPNSPLIKWVILTSLDIMGITGVKLINPDENIFGDNNGLREIQKAVNKGICDYESYTNQSHQFDDFTTKAVLNGCYKKPPDINRAYLEKTLTYAIQHNFKKQS
ncbi:SDR family oxidoreductase [Patescibacteria group bacterium]